MSTPSTRSSSVLVAVLVPVCVIFVILGAVVAFVVIRRARARAVMTTSSREVPGNSVSLGARHSFIFIELVRQVEQAPVEEIYGAAVVDAYSTGNMHNAVVTDAYAVGSIGAGGGGVVVDVYATGSIASPDTYATGKVDAFTSAREEMSMRSVTADANYALLTEAQVSRKRKSKAVRSSVSFSSLPVDEE
jgi:hypothetical protein